MKNFKEYKQLNETLTAISGIVIALTTTNPWDDSIEIENYHPIVIFATTISEAKAKLKKWYKENHPSSYDKEVLNSDWEDYIKKVAFFDNKTIRNTTIV